MVRKMISLSIVFIFLMLPSIEITRPFTGIILKRALASNQYESIIHLENYQLLEDLIVVPKQVNQKQDLVDMITRINQVDQPLLKLLNENGVKIRLFQGKLTDEPLLYFMKWQKPHGWGSDITWSQIPGAGGGWIISAKIGASMPGNGHGSINLELHEIGHTVFSLLFQKQDWKLADFQDIWKEEVAQMYPGRKYFSTYISEYFAESFAYFYYSKDTREQLNEHAPKTAAYFSGFATLNINKN